MGGIIDVDFAFIALINYISGEVIWSRNVFPGQLEDPDNGIEVPKIADIVEIDIDRTGRIIAMGVSDYHESHFDEEDGMSAGPGVLFRMEPNGLVQWGISFQLEHGLGDFEIQNTEEGFITLISENPPETDDDDFEHYFNVLTFIDPSSGFYGCESKIEINTDLLVAPLTLNGHVGVSMMNGPLDQVFTPPESQISIPATNGCCWLPFFNPLPWNHPWETVYYEEPNATITLTGYPAGYIFDWDIKNKKNIYHGDWITPNFSQSASPHNTVVIPHEKSLSTMSPYWPNSHSAERSWLEVTVTDDENCKGWDATRVIVGEEASNGALVNQMDLNAPANANEQPYLTFCHSQTAVPGTYLYRHKNGVYLSSGYSYPTNTPTDLSPVGGFNHLGTMGFIANPPFTPPPGEYVHDNFNTTTARNAVVHRNIEVINCDCNPGNLPTGIVEWKDEDEEITHYSLAAAFSDLPIVQYEITMELIDPTTFDKNLVKVRRREFPKKYPGQPIDERDFLHPYLTSDWIDHYTATYPTANLFLHLWYIDPSAQTYPYDICFYQKLTINGFSLPRKSEPGTDEKKKGEAEILLAQDDNSPLSIYPNPTTGVFNISGIRDDSRISLFSLTGQQIWSKQVNGSESVISVEVQNPGMYQLVVYDMNNEVKLVEKVVKLTD